MKLNNQTKGDQNMGDFKTYLENGMDEIEIDVDADYEPFEESTRHYPGCVESVDICEVRMVESGSEICLLPKTKDEMKEIILDMIHDMQEMASIAYEDMI
jgi:hypothetical protein